MKKDIFPILVEEGKKEEARRLIEKELARVESEPSVEVCFRGGLDLALFGLPRRKHQVSGHFPIDSSLTRD